METIKMIRDLVKPALTDEEGVTAVEYGLIAGLIAVLLIGVLTTTGTGLLAKFTSISNAVN